MIRKGERGFTLIELLIVLAIMALILGIIVPSVSGLLKVSKKEIAEANDAILRNALEMYYAIEGKYPIGDVDDLKEALVSNYISEVSWNKMTQSFEITYSCNDGTNFSLTVKSQE